MCPIPKGKQASDINKDLRPISFTSTLCKGAEDTIIKHDLKPAIMARLDCNHFGFIPGSNTTVAVIASVYRWSETVDKRADVCATGYRKAFDLMDHNVLRAKLQEIGLKLSTLNWIFNFLKGISQGFFPEFSQTGNQLVLGYRKRLR